MEIFLGIIGFMFCFVIAYTAYKEKSIDSFSRFGIILKSGIRHMFIIQNRKNRLNWIKQIENKVFNLIQVT